MTNIGILGAGQLGRMLALAGYPLGHRFCFLDPAADSPAGLLAEHLPLDYADKSALEQFARGLDVVTYEFENVPVDAARYLEKLVPVFPPPAALEKAQDRFVEKIFFQELGIPTPKFSTDVERMHGSSTDDNGCADVERMHGSSTDDNGCADVEQMHGLATDVERMHGLATDDDGYTDVERIHGYEVTEIRFPAVLKTRRLGYDGKGQVVINTEADLKHVLDNGQRDGLILEEFVAFDRELSIIAVRNASGEQRFYPLVENQHREGILRLSWITGTISAELQKQAEDYAARVMSALGYVGVLTIEFFERDGRLLANEMAPRVHNSGHWTIEGAVTSQFENHVRAVCGAPLGNTNPLGVCAMVNLVGVLPDETSILQIEGAHLHLYDKAPRPKRKLGHITLVEKDLETLQRKLEQIRNVYAEF